MSYEIEPHETQALLAELCADLLDESDPTIRYHALTHQQALMYCPRKAAWTASTAQTTESPVTRFGAA